MRAGLLALAAGLILLRFLPALPPTELLWSAWLMLPLLLWPRLRLLALFLLGLAWASTHAHWALEKRLSPQMDGQTFWIEGRVVGLPEQQVGVIRFELEEVTSRHPGLPARVRLSWYDGPVLKAGERWRLAARLKSTHGLVNPQGFDYEAWLLAQGIGATGTVKTGQRLDAALGTEGWRDRLRTALMAVDAHGRQGALAALVVADGSGLSKADWQILQDTGTVHLLVISGQHVSLLAALLFGLVAGLARWGLWPKALPWLPCASALALAGALGYGWLAGFEVPVQRACAMVAMVLLWRLCFRHLGVWLPLLVSLDVVLLLDPLASLQVGFWLSFGAVALLMWVFAGRLGRWGTWQSLWRAQWAVTLGLLPLLLALGLPVSLSGPLANLLAVPWVSILVVPLSLLGTALLPVPLVGEALLQLAGLLVDWLFQLLGWMATWQQAWMAQTPEPLVWLLLMLGALIMLLPAGLPVRALGMLLWLPLFFPPQQLPAMGRAQVWILDVGQGLAVLIRTHGHSLLYDTGPRQGDFDLGARVVLPSLRGLGVSRLDSLVLSHEDSDHAGGAEAVLRVLPAQQLISGTDGPLARRLGTEPCVSGTAWEWDQVGFSLWRWEAARNDNQASCVLMKNRDCHGEVKATNRLSKALAY